MKLVSTNNMLELGAINFYNNLFGEEAATLAWLKQNNLNIIGDGLFLANEVRV